MVRVSVPKNVVGTSICQENVQFVNINQHLSYNQLCQEEFSINNYEEQEFPHRMPDDVADWNEMNVPVGVKV